MGVEFDRLAIEIPITFMEEITPQELLGHVTTAAKKKYGGGESVVEAFVSTEQLLLAIEDALKARIPPEEINKALDEGKGLKSK